MNIPAAAQTWNPSDDTLEAPASLPAGFEEACLADKDARADARIPFEEILHDGRDCLLQMANVQFIDSTGVGQLIHLQKQLRAIDRQLVLVAACPPVQQALRRMRLEEFFSMAPDPTTAENLLTSRDREIMAGAVLHLPARAQPLKWQGEITAANSEAVWNLARTHLTNAAERSQPEVVIDLSSVRFLDSSGLGVMVRIENSRSTTEPSSFSSTCNPRSRT